VGVHKTKEALLSLVLIRSLIIQIDNSEANIILNQINYVPGFILGSVVNSMLRSNWITLDHLI